MEIEIDVHWLCRIMHAIFCSSFLTFTSFFLVLERKGGIILNKKGHEGEEKEENENMFLLAVIEEYNNIYLVHG